MSKTPQVFAAVVILAMFGSCMSNNDDTDTTSSSASTATTTEAPATPQSPVAWAPATAAPTLTSSTAPAVTGEQVTVTEVVDGDTFKTSDGRTIRVLGIDSCEIETSEGEFAKSSAEADLTNTSYPVTLTSEPGVDTDQYGRHLRYVQFGYDRADFGEDMVGWDHTGVYQGHNDASPDYIARLYAKDLQYASNPPSGRECGGPAYTPPASSDTDVYVYTDDDDYNMPDGALTGGYCARKWWC